MTGSPLLVCDTKALPESSKRLGKDIHDNWSRRCFFMCFGLLCEVYVGIIFVDGRVADNDNVHFFW